MRKITFFGFLVWNLFSGFAFSQDAEIPNGPWTDLFNGEDLTGWESLGDPPWRVEDGVIKTKGKINKNYLMWHEPLKNFELKIRYRLSSSGANSGIQVRSFCQDRKKSLPDCGGSYVLCGPQLDVAMRYSGRLFNECSGFLVQKGQNIDECRRTLEVNKWMETTARVNEDKLSLWFNGAHCLDYTFKDPEHLAGEIFALQSHPPGDLIDWEYIRIRDLDKPDPIPGCMDSNSNNYNPKATVDDSSCLTCTDKTAPNYNAYCDSNVCKDDESCTTGIGLVRQGGDWQIRVSGGARVTYSINDRGPFRLKLLDLAGNVVLERSGQGPLLNGAFNLPFEGIFIVQIETAASRYVKKLINL